MVRDWNFDEVVHPTTAVTINPTSKVYICYKTYLQSLDIDGQDGNKERMNQKPMRHEHYDRKGAKLSYSASGKERNYTKD
jgi:hypothetical protein